MPASSCPHHSVETLNRHTRECGFPKADITSYAKRLADGTAPPPPAAGDAPALKVEKNALALVFIPTLIGRAEQALAGHPGMAFVPGPGGVQPIPVAEVRAAIDPRNPQGSACGLAYGTLQALFQWLAKDIAAGILAGKGEPGHEALLLRYAEALQAYHGHTSQRATHFTPAGHLMAGINTALFFILRALSALVVLGEQARGRPLERAELDDSVRNTQPLLLTIARCHLEQLLELEGPLGKQDDLFMTRLDAAAYAERLAAMFVLAEDGGAFRLELAPAVLAALPVLSSTKPRTGCPALYASTPDNVNAIVALVRLVEQAFADICL